MKQKCTAYRILDGMPCSSQAKYEVKFDDRHVGYVCGIHKRIYGPNALIPLVETIKEVEK